MTGVRGRHAVGATAVLVSALLALAGCGETDAAGPGRERSATTVVPAVASGEASGHVLVHGTVAGAAGPARVSVVVWPLEDDTEVGEIVETLSLPTVTTAADGRWAVELDPAGVDERYLADDPSAFVNYDVNVMTDTQGAVWSSTSFLVDGRLWRSGSDEPVAGSVPAIDMDLTGGTVTLTDSVGAAETSPLTLMPPLGS